MTSRRQARRQALFLVYQWDLSGTPLGSQFAGEIDPWALELAEETVAAAAAIDARITAAADGWRAERLGAVERSALRVAICELDRGEVPPEVAIDEAVGTTKRYASEEGARLVNGILGALLREQAVGR
jgi:N utilization substance protein B